MLKMKLPMKMGEEGGGETAEDDSLEQQEKQQSPRAVSPTSERERLNASSRAHIDPPQLDKETVFEWFGLHLNPAKRIEFMCGLLHMCQPLELRFLGSYLEDLARKDYHVFRDVEFRANSPSDLGVLTEVIDPVVRSKLLVCLSLLGSDSRECAGILFRILRHVDPTLFYQNYDLSLPSFREPFVPPCQDGNAYGRELTCGMYTSETAAGPLEQLALLFTMASLHPAFHFHQREMVRLQLDKIELAIAEERRQTHRRINAKTTLTGPKAEYLPPTVLDLGECSAPHSPCQSRRSSRRAQREAVHIEGIVLRGISRTRIDKEYNFEVKWSDSSSSSVTKTHLELENFLLKLPKAKCAESFEKGILRLLNQGDQYESREMERNLRERFLSAPPFFKQSRKVCSFFNCDSSYSSKHNCCGCNCQLGKIYQGDCSDVSSQEEDLEPYGQGHKKKHGARSPTQSAKGFQGNCCRGWRCSELSGLTERRKKSSALRSNQEVEVEQHHDREKRGHPGAKGKSRVLPTDRDKGKGKGKGTAYITSGSLVSALSSQGKDTMGESSSESSTSSPQHHGAQSLDSEDDNNKDTDSHSDDSSKEQVPDVFFSRQTQIVAGNVSPALPLAPNGPQLQVEPPCSEINADFNHLPFVHSIPYMLRNGVVDSSLPLVPPPSQSVISDGKPSSGTLMMQMSLVPPTISGPGIVAEPEKRELLPTFGLPPLALPGSPVSQPLIQSFKTALSQTQGGADGPSAGASPAAPPSHPAPIRVISAMSPGPTTFPSARQQALPCQDQASISSDPASSLPLVETSLAKHPGMPLSSGLPSLYTIPPIPSSAMPSVGVSAATGVIPPCPGHVQAAVLPAVPTHTPGPAPIPSPALTHSTAHNNCTSYSNSSTFCGSVGVSPCNPISLQQMHQQQVAPLQPTPLQQQQQKQPQPMGCGTCGCHNNCGNRGSNNNNSVGGKSGNQAPIFFPAHQMAASAATRQVFSIPPAFFQLSSLCSNSYFSQAQPPHQANGAATLPPFFHPPGLPPSYGPLHTHSHSHADLPSHMLGTQAVAANYSLHQMAPSAPSAVFCQRVYQHVYPNSLGLLSAATLGSGGVNKKNGIVSCYNCGISGHYAQDCNQPSIDSTQQGGFRLKYTASHVSEALDNAD
ncbi:zinc finger CCHC domain-containing protein 2 isoform X2 [Genypterus blacodes]|uniref:zinc finger CCHC domain-containing protein 2 isoform X2 n=1 Tax=Genypterus blacodes TaxID=154954 RepID=UPI003F75D9C0